MDAQGRSVSAGMASVAVLTGMVPMQAVIAQKPLATFPMLRALDPNANVRTALPERSYGRVIVLMECARLHLVKFPTPT